MTLFTKEDCRLCLQLKRRFDLGAMEVDVEILNDENSAALAHLAWHSLVETARRQLPLLVLDDSSTIADYDRIEQLLAARAGQYGIRPVDSFRQSDCSGGSCAMN